MEAGQRFQTLISKSTNLSLSRLTVSMLKNTQLEYITLNIAFLWLIRVWLEPARRKGSKSGRRQAGSCRRSWGGEILATSKTKRNTPVSCTYLSTFLHIFELENKYWNIFGDRTIFFLGYWALQHPLFNILCIHNFVVRQGDIEFFRIAIS